MVFVLMLLAVMTFVYQAVKYKDFTAAGLALLTLAIFFVGMGYKLH